MKLFLLKRTDTIRYDQYDSCIVCAKDEADAKTIFPGYSPPGSNRYGWSNKFTCTKIGLSDTCERGVILASFNAG